MKMSQKVWETWFISSVILLIILLIIGTTDLKINNFHWYMILSIINLVICFYFGLDDDDDDDPDRKDIICMDI